MAGKTEVPPRPISAHELSVVRAVLQVGLFDPEESPADDFESLIVVGGCTCGCDTVLFRRPCEEGYGPPIADAVGETPGGDTVGLIVFGTRSGVHRLEVYGLKGDEDLRLPRVDSIRPY